MSFTKNIITSSLIILLSVKSDAQKNIPGRYKTSGINAGIVVTIKNDLSFTYKRKNAVAPDTAAGTIILSGDTLTLQYIYNNYDTVLTGKAPSITPEMRLNASLAATHRPKRMVFISGKLYFIDEKTGQLRTYLYNNKTEYVFMTKF